MGIVFNLCSKEKMGGHVTVDIYIIEALFQTLKMCQIMFQK